MVRVKRKGNGTGMAQKDNGKRSEEVTQRDLHKLKRSELLEIMLAQSEEIDRLRAELKLKDKQLAQRAIAIKDSGSIAEASLKLTRVFEEAQKAADLYLYNVTGSAGLKSDAAPASGDGEERHTSDSASEDLSRDGDISQSTIMTSESESQAEEPRIPIAPLTLQAEDYTESDDWEVDDSVDGKSGEYLSHADKEASADDSAIPGAHAAGEHAVEKSLNGHAEDSGVEGRPAEGEDTEGQPGEGLKSIEDLIDELKVSGAKHRG